MKKCAEYSTLPFTSLMQVHEAMKKDQISVFYPLMEYDNRGKDHFESGFQKSSNLSQENIDTKDKRSTIGRKRDSKTKDHTIVNGNLHQKIPKINDYKQLYKNGKEPSLEISLKEQNSPDFKSLEEEKSDSLELGLRSGKESEDQKSCSSNIDCEPSSLYSSGCEDRSKIHELNVNTKQKDSFTQPHNVATQKTKYCANTMNPDLKYHGDKQILSTLNSKEEGNVQIKNTSNEVFDQNYFDAENESSEILPPNHKIFKIEHIYDKTEKKRESKLKRKLKDTIISCQSFKNPLINFSNKWSPDLKESKCLKDHEVYIEPKFGFVEKQAKDDFEVPHHEHFLNECVEDEFIDEYDKIESKMVPSNYLIHHEPYLEISEHLKTHEHSHIP